MVNSKTIHRRARSIVVLLLLSASPVACHDDDNRSAPGIGGELDISNVDLPDTLSEINMIIADHEIEVLKESAVSGDNDAANRLGNHYSQLGQSREEARWLTLAARRGHCASMSRLRERADQAGDRVSSARWNEALRQNECTWGKTYPGVSNPSIADVPLWKEE